MDQNLKQKKIALAQSEHAPIIVEIIKDCIPQTPLVANTEWETLRNAIIFDTYSTMVVNVVEYLDKIRQGILHEQK